MRLSRPRVVLRIALLVAGGAFMLWRAYEAWRASGELEGGAATLQSRIALIAALIGVLALLTAIGAAASLRERKRGGSLRLGASSPPRSASADPPRHGSTGE